MNLIILRLTTLMLSICLASASVAQSQPRDLALTSQSALYIAPAQVAWHFTTVPAKGEQWPWPEAFAFKDLHSRSENRWLGFAPRDPRWIDAYYDTVDKQWVSLAPSARVLCDGNVVESVRALGIVLSTGLPVSVGFWNNYTDEELAIWKKTHAATLAQIDPKDPRWIDGNKVFVGAMGRLNHLGQWDTSPVKCPTESPLPAANTPRPAAVQIDVPPTQPQVELVDVLDYPGLRDKLSGRWLTPKPPQDPVTLRWHELMRGDPWFNPQIYAFGVIDRTGRMVVPFIFDKLPDVQPNGTLQICRQHLGKPLCMPHSLARLQAKRVVLQAQRQADGKWGYVDRTGRLTLPAVYDEARPFVNGYAVVSARLPLGWVAVRNRQPIIRSIKRVGHAWVVAVTQQGPLESAGRNMQHSAVMDDQGRWLVPSAD
jgi:hypothetical protein